MSLKVAKLRVTLAGRRILDDVGFEASSGVVALRGENGSGKTTLLAALAGLTPYEGSITIAGRSLERERAAALRATGWVPERSDAPEELTPRELVELVAALRRASTPPPEVVDRFGLRDVYDIRRDAISLGQRRRADLLAAFVGGPPVLLLDEPTNGLDAHTTGWLTERLRAHADGGGLALVATHDDRFIERAADRTLHLAGGRIT